MNFSTISLGSIVSFNAEPWRFTSIGVTYHGPGKGGLTVTFKKDPGAQLPPNAPVLWLDATFVAFGTQWEQDASFWINRAGGLASLQLNCKPV